MSETKTTAGDLRAAIRAKFASPGYQVFYEVGNDTGTRVTRHADAVAVGIWPSTGHLIHGFEIKVSRSDFLREMKDPGKCLPIFRHCHRWSLAVPAGLVTAAEIPPGWGLYSLTAGGVLREAVRPETRVPEALTPGFLAALVRRAGEADELLVKNARAEVENKWRKKFDEDVAAAVERAREGRGERARRLKETVEKIEALAGLKVEDWRFDPASFGLAVRLLHDVGISRAYGDFAHLAKTLEQAHKTVSEALARFPRDKGRS